MANQEEVKYDFSEKTVKRRRKFPKANVIWLVVLIILQIGCVVGIFLIDPGAHPQDKIDSYQVFVTPKEDGTLDIEYRFTWTPLDPDEALTFVYVGVANPDYTVVNYSLNITSIEEYEDEYGECHMDLHLDKEYYEGETIEFYVIINQKNMLCEKDGQIFYEFVPCWFNSTPIDSYTFYWKAQSGITSTNADKTIDEWYIWQGSMNAGEYRMMTVKYESFDALLLNHKIDGKPLIELVKDLEYGD